MACSVLMLIMRSPLFGAELVVDADDRGLTVKVGERTILAPEDGLARVFKVKRREADGSEKREFDPSPRSRSWDPAQRLLALEYPWGGIEVGYEARGSELACQATIRNDSTAVIEHVELFVIHLRMPLSFGNANATAGPLGALLRIPGGTIALVNANADTVCHVRPQFPTKNGGVPIQLSNRLPRVARHPVVDNRWFNTDGVIIPPKTTAIWRCTLTFGPPDATVLDLVPRLAEDLRQEKPLRLDWPDRRPIGTVFWAHPWKRWPSNPRGFNFGRGERHDVFTEEGVAVFGQELMQYVDRTIANVKAMNGQGVIVWDLEGEEMWHPASYVADPARLPDCAPEMDRHADDVFARFAAAGLRTGITIRPTEYFRKAPGLFNWSQRDVHDPVECMAAKIAYAKKRWGCTLFYLDSNVFGSDFEPKLPRDHSVPWVMPAAMIEALHERCPDVLIIPEWASLDYLRWSAPYATHHQGLVGSDAEARRVYPRSFRVVAVHPRLAQDRWDTLVENVRGGDILLFPAWYGAPENTMVRLAYEEARLRDAEERLAAQGDPPGGVSSTADVGLRYHVARRLDRLDPAVAADIAVRLLDDGDPLVRQAALTSLARGTIPVSSECEARLLEWLQGREDPLGWLMRRLAATAIGRCGERLVPTLVDRLADAATAEIRCGYIRAIAATGTRHPAAQTALVDVLAVQPAAPRDVRAAAIEALGTLRSEQAVPLLLDVLANTDPGGEPERGAAVVALGRIGDARAAPALVAYWQRNHGSTVYWIPDALDTALRAITGEESRGGAQQWRQWLDLTAPR